VKKFVFRLETLLQHRQSLEERERTKFSRVRGELLAEQANLQQLQTKHQETRSDLASKKTGDCDGGEIDLCYRFLNRLDREIVQSTRRLVQLQMQVEKQKQSMIEASRDRKMIENLREKREKEFQVALEQGERKAVDEIVVTRFGFRQ